MGAKIMSQEAQNREDQNISKNLEVKFKKVLINYISSTWKVLIHSIGLVM